MPRLIPVLLLNDMLGSGNRGDRQRRAVGPGPTGMLLLPDSEDE